ncbi:hypothetical protein HMPREF0491_02308 [Lachnospiraceae oral taxon 107 str. F0167]|nr:hypothetical protein HMPREF0491_02308 [Lachnospiraceae oral taxon 107 str. F0167]
MPGNMVIYCDEEVIYMNIYYKNATKNRWKIL